MAGRFVSMDDWIRLGEELQRLDPEAFASVAEVVERMNTTLRDPFGVRSAVSQPQVTTEKPVH